MTNERIVHPMPGVELLGHPLDLGRDELADVMNRYSGRRPVSQRSMLSPPAVLVVGDRTPSPLKAQLEDDGWTVRTCGGPSTTSECPVMRGRRCALRESVDVAVVFVDTRRDGAGASTLPLLRCAADSGSPAVVALEGRLDGARYEGKRAAVGALRGPVAIAAAAQKLVEQPD